MNILLKQTNLSFLISFLFWMVLLTTKSYGAATITSAAFNGTASTTVYASDAVTVDLNVTVPSNNSADAWKSTAYRIGSSGSYTCVNTADYTSAGNHSASFSITAPATTGSYSVSLIAYSDKSCSSNTSNTYTKVNAITVIADPTTYSNTRAFALRHTLNARGDISVIGNTVLCKSTNQTSGRWESGSCTKPGDTEANNDFYAINNILDPARTNSSSANLALPSGSKILWAELYWQGIFPTNFATDKNTAKTIKFKIPGTSTYNTVTASQLDYSGSAYQGIADVTSLLNLNNPNGDYDVADMVTKLGKSAYGAWALSIMYEDDNDNLKNMTAYDGFKAIFASSSTQTVDVSGFRTPLSGPIASTFFIFAAEGDAAYTGEGLQIKNGAGVFQNIYNSLNPSNNQFNSNITYKGNLVTNRNPSWPNTAGNDIDTYDVSGILENNQTSTQIKLIGGGNDQYYVGTFGFSTQIYSPTIGHFDKNATVTYASNSSCSIGKDLRGATIHYSMTFQNTGTEAASNVKVYDDFQSNNILSYLDMNQTTIPTVQLLSGTGASTVTCDKNSTAIYCNFDRIAINTQYKISFDVKVKSSLSTANDITLTNTANAHYYNASTGDEITQIATSNMQMAGGICAILPVADYRFDECSWKGISGEVSDSSGNGYNGSINQALTTSSGGALCQTTIFNGTSQYISVPQTATNTLLSTASLSFWIKTTQTGNDTDWLAPGVTGVEQAGTNNDIFWGWLDGSGKIGLNALGDGVQAKSSISINDGTWRHIVLTRDASTGLLQIYINGVLNASATSGTGTVGTTFSSIGRIEDTGGTPAYFSGSLDEVKIFDRVLNPDEIATIYSNESAGDNFNGSVRTCNDCTIIPTAVAFDAWDIFRSISDRKISTKIVGKDFNLAVTSLDQTLSALQSFNGTVCVQLLTFATNSELARQCKAWSNVTTNTYGPFNILQASDDTKVRIAWKKDDMSGTFNVGSEDNSSIASDYFAIRPDSFAITASNAIAGTGFNIIFSAPVFNVPNTPSSSYNETSGNSFDVNISEHNVSCTQGIFTATATPASFSFFNGTTTVTTHYSEVGILDINISDLSKPCTSRFAHVDCNDANVAGYYNSTIDLPIGFAQKSITVTPHHFDVIAALSNAVTGFTYLSTDLNMSADLNITVTAQTEGNTTTKNYNTLCYAQPTNYSIQYLPLSIAPSGNLANLNYFETNTSTSSSVATVATAFNLNNLPNSIFGTDINGSAKLNIKINFDRSSSKPVNPFDLNIASVIATDSSVSGNDSAGIGNATFIYGRVHPYDITNNVGYAPNPVEFEVYSTASNGYYVNGMPQNVLHWYRNTNHSSNIGGSVRAGGFSAGLNDINVSPGSFQNGTQIVTVTSSVDQTVHLDINSWLWYSLNPIKSYNYGTDCTQHPCFQYKYTNTTGGVKGVSSGSFQGSDFGMTPAQNITNKGVKLFR
ncbi:LamG-like jellyroll fold domain-containing protein [Sulfuricurvum sp.]|uniref:LamG-like jellyroll fold domain-containing protein n=1 Tax=Sulfuricurvum sp. TaxID=2025608 RepID=UPI003567ECE7